MVTFVVVCPIEAGVVPMITGPVNGTAAEADPLLVGVTVACCAAKELLVDGGPEGGVEYKDAEGERAVPLPNDEEEDDSGGSLNPAGGEPTDPARVGVPGDCNLLRESRGGMGMGSCVRDRGLPLVGLVGDPSESPDNEALSTEGSRISKLAT